MITNRQSVPLRVKRSNLKDAEPSLGMERRKHGQGGGGNDDDDTVGFTASPIPSLPFPSTGTSLAALPSTIPSLQGPTVSSSPGIITIPSPATPPSLTGSITPHQTPSSSSQIPPANAGKLPQGNRNNDPQPTSHLTIPLSTPGPSSTTSTGTQSLLQFQDPFNSTVCASLDLTWLFVGHELFSMTLYVQSMTPGLLPVAQQIPPSAHVLSTNVSVADSKYTWSPVIAAAGWYIANSFDNQNSSGIFMRSSPFFIGPPLNDSCLQTIPNNSSNSTLNHSQKARPSDGAIVGLSVGITAGVALLLAAFLYPRLWRKELPSHDRNRPYLLY